ncbi:unnamed protein product [Heligmosomoides polygyrus]|uniref:FH2 domain-containing protein n=1 Tax=Heligmosomoides polygyrus TaxID=6339 RepID=A0A183FZR1_HELPZ|nr:unnamed protein product [Heligmosomoides polygyrus]
MAKEFDNLLEEVKATESKFCEYYLASTWDMVGEVDELIVAMEEIPTFSGNLEERDTNWGLFCSLVHEQEPPPLRKFAYLLSTLAGEAKEALSGFQFREEN